MKTRSRRKFEKWVRGLEKRREKALESIALPYQDEARKIMNDDPCRFPLNGSEARSQLKTAINLQWMGLTIFGTSEKEYKENAKMYSTARRMAELYGEDVSGFTKELTKNGYESRIVQNSGGEE